MVIRSTNVLALGGLFSSNGPVFLRDERSNLGTISPAHFHPDQLSPWHWRSRRKSALESDGWVNGLIPGPCPGLAVPLGASLFLPCEERIRGILTHDDCICRPRHSPNPAYLFHPLRGKSLLAPNATLRPWCVSFYSWVAHRLSSYRRHCFGAYWPRVFGPLRGLLEQECDRIGPGGRCQLTPAATRAADGPMRSCGPAPC